MVVDRILTLRLSRADYDRLEAAAIEVGLPPATFARICVRDHLRERELAGDTRLRFRAALENLQKYSESLPPLRGFDPVQAIREDRESDNDQIAFRTKRLKS